MKKGIYLLYPSSVSPHPDTGQAGPLLPKTLESRSRSPLSLSDSPEGEEEEAEAEEQPPSSRARGDTGTEPWRSLASPEAIDGVTIRLPDSQYRLISRSLFRFDPVLLAHCCNLVLAQCSSSSTLLLLASLPAALRRELSPCTGDCPDTIASGFSSRFCVDR
jgi:hypothetical protein